MRCRRRPASVPAPCGTVLFRVAGAQAATDHEQANGSVAAIEAQRRRRQRGDLRAHRIADDARMRRWRERRKETRRALRAPAAPGSDWCIRRSHSARGSPAAGGRARRPVRPARSRSRPGPPPPPGLWRRTMASAWNSARSNWNGAASSVSRPLPRNPPTESHSTGKPSAGTTRASSPRRVPSHTTSRELERNNLASASAGNTWPPVPPAMMSTGRALIWTRSPSRAPRPWPRDTRAAPGRTRPASPAGCCGHSS